MLSSAQGKIAAESPKTHGVFLKNETSQVPPQ
jgi:hypothetical protein